MVSGLRYPTSNPKDKAMQNTNYSAISDWAEDFRKENGSIVCKELLGLVDVRQNPAKRQRTEKNDTQPKEEPKAESKTGSKAESKAGSKTESKTETETQQKLPQTQIQTKEPTEDIEDIVSSEQNEKDEYEHPCHSHSVSTPIRIKKKPCVEYVKTAARIVGIRLGL